MKVNNKGFGLIEVLISVGLMAIIALGTATLIKNMQKGVADVRSTANRDYVAALIKHYAGNNQAIKVSVANAPGSAFERCVASSGGGTCLAAQTEFNLYDTGGLKIAGTIAIPVRYTQDGAICTVISETCPFEAITWYTADCPAGFCGAGPANFLSINYMVRKAATATGFSYKFVCSSGAPGCTITTPPPGVTIAIPLDIPTAVAVDRLSYWASTTGQQPSSIRQNGGVGNIFINETNAGNNVNCTATDGGALRTNNGSLQVCDSTALSWKMVAGKIDSNASAPAGYPSLKNLYLCPAEGNATRCGGANVCMGQVSRIATCCMDRAVQIGPAPPMGVIQGADANAACTSMN